MQLDKINKINDIKKLSISDKEELTGEIRDYLLEVVSKTGGHLASNLGIVELTIALESVFDVTKDNIIWDVGHQCYVHKILTGRKNDLKKMRQFNGISGFPKTSESYTDSFNTGHSSTSISAAIGIATARDIKKSKNHVIAVIGDGALTGGMAMEALNHVGFSGKDIIVILNDNEMSISKNIGGMNRLLTKLRVKRNYTKSNDFWKTHIGKIPIIGRPTTKSVGRVKNSLKQLIIPSMYFEDIGFRYLGPVDGHNISDMEDLFSKAKEKKKDDYSEIFGRKLVSLAKKNKSIVAITAAMKDGTGLTEFSQKYPDRFFDVGIAEQHALTFAAGLAKSGLIPFISLYSSFYQRGYDQVIHDICLQNLHVVMCIDRAGVVGNDGPTHHGLFDLAFFRLVPNIVIMAPRDYKELEMMMEMAVEIDKPVSIRYPRGSEAKINYPCKKIKMGKCDILETGDDLTIVTIGNSVYKGIVLSEKLKEDNISSEVINCRFLKPFDSKNIIKSIDKTKKVVVIEDGTIIGGLCSAIKETIIDNNLKDVTSKYFAYPDKFIPHGSIPDLEKKYQLDDESIYKNTIKMFK